MWWHAEAYRLIGLRPAPDPVLSAAVDLLERCSGLRVTETDSQHCRRRLGARV